MKKGKATSLRYWWISMIVLSILAALLLFYAAITHSDIGDYSTLVQALFAIILGFATISNMQIARRQIEHSERIEEAHEVVLDFVDNTTFFVANINKHPIFISSMFFSHTSRDNPGLLLAQSVVITAGGVLKFDIPKEDLNLEDSISRYVTASALGDPLPEAPFAGLRLDISYQYGGTPGISYWKEFKFHSFVYLGVIGSGYPPLLTSLVELDSGIFDNQGGKKSRKRRASKRHTQED